MRKTTVDYFGLLISGKKFKTITDCSGLLISYVSKLVCIELKFVMLDIEGHNKPDILLEYL